MSLLVKFMTTFVIGCLFACSPINDGQDSKHEFVPFPTKKAASRPAAPKPNDEPANINKGTRDIGLPGWAQSQNSFQLLLAILTKDPTRKTKEQNTLSFLALFDQGKEDFPTFLEQEVNALVEILKANHGYKVELLGSTDDQEIETSPERIKFLIERRAEIVKADLEARGIDSARITINNLGNNTAIKDRSDQRLLRSVRANLSLNGLIE